MAKVDKSKEIIGTPPIGLLPKNNYKYNINSKEVIINIPIDDNIVGISDIFDAENNVFYMRNISDILIKLELYPKLKQNQLFSPSVVLFKKKAVEIIGNVITMIE